MNGLTERLAAAGSALNKLLLLGGPVVLLLLGVDLFCFLRLFEVGMDLIFWRFVEVAVLSLILRLRMLPLSPPVALPE